VPFTNFNRTLEASVGYFELGMAEEALRELDTLEPADQSEEEVLELRLVLNQHLGRWAGAAEACAGLCAIKGADIDRLVECIKAARAAGLSIDKYTSAGVNDNSGNVWLASEDWTGCVYCSIGFDVAAVDERAYAERIARRFATDHRSREVAADDFGLIDTLAYHFDEPFADASALPTYRVCELAREEVTVALSGDGADEALAEEISQLIYHLQTLMLARGLSINDVYKFL
jgi:hypothetical protein